MLLCWGLWTVLTCMAAMLLQARLNADYASMPAFIDEISAVQASKRAFGQYHGINAEEEVVQLPPGVDAVAAVQLAVDSAIAAVQLGEATEEAILEAVSKTLKGGNEAIWPCAVLHQQWTGYRVCATCQTYSCSLGALCASSTTYSFVAKCCR